MPKVGNNLHVPGISGSIGNMVIRKMPDGSPWISTAADFSSWKLSDGQLSYRSRFKQAAAYARQAEKSRAIYAQLTAATINNAYNYALSNWFDPPVIHRICPNLSPSP